MLPEPVKTSIEQTLNLKIQNAKYVGGGSINKAARLETPEGFYFLKWNDAARYPGMFDAENKGLLILRECSEFKVPEVITSGIAGDTSFLLMEFIERGTTDWRNAGMILGAMHRCQRLKVERFGLDHDNYIGSLKQSNSFHNTWADFFANERILPQVRLALENHLLSANDMHAAERFCKEIGNIFPNEKPSLLHGDLWSGNFMFTGNGPSVFDPAVYWGHREMDIAMTRLFGGFDEEFYEGYNEDHPLGKSWEKRIEYCNLYPLLVHVNLFGGSYVREVRNILSAF